MPAAPVHAAIDIGTNALLALVGRVGGDGRVERLADFATITRLGAGVDATRALRPDAMARALDALRDFVARARALGARRVSAVATSAVRDASNREEFLAAARAITGGDVEAISGAREAELTFAGAFAGTPVARGADALVFDVGGGSTEVIHGPAGGAPRGAVSLDVGSVRLTERCVADDPPSTAELARVRAAIDAELARVGAPPPHAALVGIAGTVTTLAAIDALARGGAAEVHGAVLTRDAVERVARLLASLPLAARSAVPGLDPRRADVIVVGAEIVRAVTAWAGDDALVVSDGGVRVGLLLERASTE